MLTRKEYKELKQWLLKAKKPCSADKMLDYIYANYLDKNPLSDAFTNTRDRTKFVHECKPGQTKDDDSKRGIKVMTEGLSQKGERSSPM